MKNMNSKKNYTHKLFALAFVVIAFSGCTETSFFSAQNPNDQSIELIATVRDDGRYTLKPTMIPTCWNLTTNSDCTGAVIGAWSDGNNDDWGKWLDYKSSVSGLTNFHKYGFTYTNAQDGRKFTATGTPGPVPSAVTGVTYECLEDMTPAFSFYGVRKKIRVRWTNSPSQNVTHRFGILTYGYTNTGRGVFNVSQSQYGFDHSNLTEQFVDFVYGENSYTLASYSVEAISVVNGIHESITELSKSQMQSAVCPAVSPAAFNLTSATAGNAQVNLAWAASTGASSYTVKYGTSSGNYSNEITNVINNSKLITGLTNGQTYYFKVTAVNNIGSTDSTNELSATPSAGSAPGAFTLSSATAGDTEVILSWNNSAGATSYDVKYGTVSGTYTTTLSNQTSPKTVTGLSNGQTYYFRVTANNVSGSVDSSNQLSSMPTAAATFKKIYVTDLSYTADLSSGGMANEIVVADGFCASDTNKPSGGGTYKAMIVSSLRVACTTANCGGGTGEHTDWVLAPSTEYRQADGTTVIGTTTANGVFTFPLTNAVGASAIVMTGLNTDWTSATDNCTDWSTSVAGDYVAGEASSTSNTFLNNGSLESCATVRPLICVEQ